MMLNLGTFFQQGASGISAAIQNKAAEVQKKVTSNLTTKAAAQKATEAAISKGSKAASTLFSSLFKSQAGTAKAESPAYTAPTGAEPVVSKSFIERFLDSIAQFLTSILGG